MTGTAISSTAGSGTLSVAAGSHELRGKSNEAKQQQDARRGNGEAVSVETPPHQLPLGGYEDVLRRCKWDAIEWPLR